MPPEPTTAPLTADEVGTRLEPLLARVAAAGASADAQRRPDPAVMRAIAEADLLRLVVPVESGGHGVHPGVFLDFTERLARVHGSTAWTAMTCNEEAGITSMYLDGATVAALYRSEPHVIIAGSGAPNGHAQRVDGGWVVTGRWGFVSGCTAADRWILVSAVEGSDPLEFCAVLVPADPTQIDETWDTVGLTGTGSHHVELTNQFVADEWAGALPAASLAAPHERPGQPDTAFYRLPAGLRFPFPKVGVAAGLARRALDDFEALAGAKRPLFNRADLRSRPDAGRAAAEATALLGSGVAYVRDRLEILWDIATAGDPIPARLHAEVRLACSTAVRNCIEGVELLATAAGSTSNFRSSPLSGTLNDVRAVAGHFTVAGYQIDTAGRVLLGLDAGDRTF